MKKVFSVTLMAVLAVSFVFGAMTTNVRADDTVPLCYVYCDGIYEITCCPEYVKVNPNCKGKGCRSGWCFP